MHKLLHLTIISKLVLFSGLTACNEKTATAAAPAATKMTMADLVQKTRTQLVPVKGGEFQMGDFGEIHSDEKLPYSHEQHDGPLHKVTLSDYAILKNKVTLAEYRIFAAATGRPQPYSGPSQTPVQKDVLAHPRSADFPVKVDWASAKAYCEEVGKALGRTMGLPTEAEWEFAARNRGGMTIFPTNNGKEEVGVNFATFRQAFESADGINGTMAVASFPASPLGLHDMGANGFEWASDWYGEDYYARSPASNPQGPDSGAKRVLRSRNNGGDHSAMTFERSASMPSRPAGDDIGINEHTFRCVAR